MPNFGNKIASGVALIAAGIAGCASVPKTATIPHPLVPSANAAAISGIRSWVDRESREAQSMYATGDISVEQNGESNSASFSMKSKREDAGGDQFGTGHSVSHRVDSLSIEITGPFGIKVARFIASPEKYEFYDILHDQTLSGRTDRESLEDLTHLSGISLQDMSDIVYGLVRIDSSSGDSVELYSDNANRFALVVREPDIATDVYDFQGALPADSAAGNLSLVRYRRWQGTPANLDEPPALNVQFMEPAMINGVSVPQHIEATAGNNKLTLEYDHIELNPVSLVVKIKMP